MWTIRIDAKAERELGRLSGTDRQRILRFLHNRLAHREDPRSIGDALAGPLSGFWRYRVGDFRVIARISDREITIYVMRIGNRREVYR
ncbi:type II toxin-antitoxin system RelE family toxin [Brucella endophytica]|uniref:type II toxin-antitoxin system RelE family toxin n=1 Tax=Brucella endophytica TaxID=1963359 RepID=UPI00166352EC|nr:type II toxin-antitoxin system RelE/ParE family toxin [Brucella endophytica]